MEKILFHEESPTEVHAIEHYLATHTLCGERLIHEGCVHVINDRVPVTCKTCYCLSDFDEEK